MERNEPKSGSQQPLVSSSEPTPNSASGAKINAERSLFRRLATNPMFYSVAIALSGMMGIKSGETVQAQSIQENSSSHGSETMSARTQSLILDVFDPFASDTTKSLGIDQGTRQQLEQMKSNPMRFDSEIMKKMEDFDPDKLEQITLEPEAQVVRERIEKLLGVDHNGKPVKIIIPADFSKIPWHKFEDNDNHPMPKVYWERLEEGLLQLSRDEYGKRVGGLYGDNEIGKSLMPLRIIVKFGNNCHCGMYVENKNDRYVSVTYTRNVSLNREIKSSPMYSNNKEYLPKPLIHELHHSWDAMLWKLMEDYIRNMNWYWDFDPAYNFWRNSRPEDVYYANRDPNNRVTFVPYEEKSNALAEMLLRPDNYLLLPPHIQNWVAQHSQKGGFFENYPMWQIPQVKAVRDQWLANPMPTVEPRTPTPTSTSLPTETPRPTNTPRTSATSTPTDRPDATSTSRPSKTPTSRPSATPWIQTRVPHTPTPTDVSKPKPSQVPTIDPYVIRDKSIFLPLTGKGTEIKTPPEVRRESNRGQNGETLSLVLEPDTIHTVGQMAFVMMSRPIA